MSRIGNQSIIVPANVTVNFAGSQLEVSGVKGKLSVTMSKGITLEVKDKELILKRINDEQNNKALHGLNRSLVQNAVIGVSEGWSKTLQLVGVGFRAQTDGKKLTLTVGYSHPVIYEAPEGIIFTVKGNDITVTGFDKQLVGETTARIRRVRPPEIYKGKGIRYKNEVIHLKPGKAAKTVGVGGGAAAGAK